MLVAPRKYQSSPNPNPNAPAALAAAEAYYPNLLKPRVSSARKKGWYPGRADDALSIFEDLRAVTEFSIPKKLGPSLSGPNGILAYLKKRNAPGPGIRRGMPPVARRPRSQGGTGWFPERGH